MKYFSIIFVILCLLYTTIFGLNELINQSRCTSTGALKESIEYLENIVSEGDIVVSSVWPYYGYYLNLEVYSSWTENIDYLLEEYNFNYLVISKRAGVVFETDVSHYSLVLLESFNDDCGFDIEIYKVID